MGVLMEQLAREQAEEAERERLRRMDIEASRQRQGADLEVHRVKRLISEQQATIALCEAMQKAASSCDESARQAIGVFLSPRDDGDRWSLYDSGGSRLERARTKLAQFEAELADAHAKDLSYHTPARRTPPPTRFSSPACSHTLRAGRSWPSRALFGKGLCAHEFRRSTHISCT
jgi:hypothetical protein